MEIHILTRVRRNEKPRGLSKPCGLKLIVSRPLFRLHACLLLNISKSLSLLTWNNANKIPLKILLFKYSDHINFQRVFLNRLWFMGHTRKSSQEKEKGKWVGMGYGTKAKRHYPHGRERWKTPGKFEWRNLYSWWIKHLKGHPANYPKREAGERPERAAAADSIINLLSTDLSLLASPMRHFCFQKENRCMSQFNKGGRGRESHTCWLLEAWQQHPHPHT